MDCTRWNNFCRWNYHGKLLLGPKVDQLSKQPRELRKWWLWAPIHSMVPQAGRNRHDANQHLVTLALCGVCFVHLYGVVESPGRVSPADVLEPGPQSPDSLARGRRHGSIAGRQRTYDQFDLKVGQANPVGLHSAYCTIRRRKQQAAREGYSGFGFDR